jgi:ADP-heptose:LPS heptosyltransferase
MLGIVALAGAEPVTLVPTVRTTDADRMEADRLDLPSDRPIVALNPGASDPERRWPPERFAAVGDAALEAGAAVIVTGASFDAPLADAIRATMRGQAFDMTGRLSLGGLAALLQRCAVVISNDTGPLHLAMAVGAATVGLYWCFNYLTAMPLAMSRHRPVISWRVNCPVCGIDRAAATCDHHPSFLADLPAETAIQPMLDLLASA